MKILAIGDVHTKTHIIDKVWEVIDNYNAVVFVGDYADDWNSTPVDSIETWRKLKDFQEAHPDKVKLVIGNHDYIYVNRTNSISSGYNIMTQTLLNSPENKQLKEWISNLPLSLELDGVLYSHAGLVDEWDEKYGYWNDASPIWVRPDSLLTYKDVPQVFGHTPSRTCHRITGNIWCIDTFSTYHDTTPIGDGTVLEVTDGKQFNKRVLENIKPL